MLILRSFDSEKGEVGLGGMRTVSSYLAIVVLVLSGCLGSRPYAPIPGPETIETAKASRDIYPDDVRRNLSAYGEAVVVWPGVILATKVDILEGTCFQVTSTVAHHYYDWIEDFGMQKETIFLSPQGEGVFRVTWPLCPKAADVTAEEAARYAPPGSMAIVYGTPEFIEADDIVRLRYHYIRVIGKEWYRMDVFEYGRAPIKKIKWLGH
ncbi:MAG: hypothetical protein U0587_10450 [Candidatus Binatia bacterium]